jgi:hypothetical protein
MMSLPPTARLTRALAVLSSLGLAAGLAAGCTSGGTSQSPATSSGLAALSPRQILSRAEAAATAAGSLHFSSTTKDGSSSIVFSDDSASSDGRQDITISSGGQMTVLVLRGVGYVDGNATALSGFLGLPSPTALQLAGRWISFTSGDPGYQQVVSGVTTGAVLSEITPVGALTKTAPTTVDGQTVVGVRGPAPASDGMPAGSKVTVYVAATGRPLPVSCLEGSGSDQTDITLSRWGEPVSVAVPQQAIPLPAPSAPAGPPGVA